MSAWNASPLVKLTPWRRAIVHTVYVAFGVAERAKNGSATLPFADITKSGSYRALATQNPEASNFPCEPLKMLSLIHISEPTRQAEISYAVFCLKKKKK